MNDTLIREYFEELPSTNDYAKSKRNEGKDLLVVAKRQTGGRGTKGRSFSSEEGGSYLSLLTFYDGFPASKAFAIMQNAAAATCETLAALGLSPKIKWPNDIFVDGKKICGILIENVFSGSFVSSSVVGIGLNVYNRLDGLEDIATSIEKCTGKRYAVEDIERELVARLRLGVDEKYAGYLGWIGREVTLETGTERLRAYVLGVDEGGNLIARTQAGERRFSSAEVRISKEGL